jgi:hypothetical protein
MWFYCVDGLQHNSCTDDAKKLVPKLFWWYASVVYLCIRLCRVVGARLVLQCDPYMPRCRQCYRQSAFRQSGDWSWKLFNQRGICNAWRIIMQCTEFKYSVRVTSLAHASEWSAGIIRMLCHSQIAVKTAHVNSKRMCMFSLLWFLIFYQSAVAHFSHNIMCSS